ncbi:uncharacterized protein LOC143023195 isoform X2 [Oratosquilla oratoria]|uniref:uncharacterized protein LOC143023195 isoform X2 n=1 Tax=Oratosquilla oratoria TaxID=337810 RepID=UPI003F76B5AB
MRLLLSTWVCFILVMKASCTDLFAIYSKDLYVVRNADGDPSDIKETKLSASLVAPMAIAHDMEHNRIFVADLWSSSGLIIAINLSEDYSVLSVDTVTNRESYGISNVIKTMTYDPRHSILYWTDSREVGVWKVEIPDPLKDVKKPVFVHGQELNIVNPSGIALDYCSEKLYWSDVKETGEIEAFNLDTQHHEVVQSAKRSGVEFQAIDVDLKKSELMWAETTGDSCVLKTEDLLTTRETVLLQKNNCSPHDLTHDDKYIYWSDKNGEGIFRISRGDSKEVTKIVNAPNDKKHGLPIEAFGLTTLSHNVESIRNICSQGLHKPRNGSTQTEQDEKNYEKANHTTILAQPTNENKISGLSENQTKASKLTEDDLGHAEDNIKDEGVATKSSILPENKETKDSSWVEDAGTKTPIPVENKGIPVSVQDEVERTKVLVTSYDIQGTSTSASKDNEYIHVPLKIIESGRSNKSTAIRDENSEERKIFPPTPTERCSNNLYLIPVVISLTVVCVIFMLSTLFLVIAYYRRVPKYPGKQHVPRIFGPRRKATNKPARCRVDDDGVRIDIEDCCQMTECETLTILP